MPRFEFHLPSLEEMRGTPDGLEMLRMIDDDSFRSALVTGCPGSGKTTVSIYRLVRINNQRTNVHLVTFQNMLVQAIRNLANIQSVPRERVSTFHKWYCPLTNSGFNIDAPPTPEEMARRIRKSPLSGQQIEELLIDEGQDLPLCVYQVLPQYFERVFVGADNGQQVHPKHGAKIEEIENILRTDFGPYRRFPLGRNFRNTYETYLFARQFIPKTNQVAWDEAIPERLLRSNRRGPKPTVISYHDNNQRNQHLKTILQNAEGNVAILCPLATESRLSGESVNEVYTLIKNMGITATKYHSQTDVPDSLERYVVTTFISSKGLEFDVVIIPRINFFKNIPEEWYVASTRARKELFVFRDLNDPQNDPTSGFDPGTYNALDAETPVPEEDVPF
ncbi:MAG: AAA family ATPase [Deltaproteobacteria bacterium]|jgi:superfamily I DNA/RNA helicase|nr:AAA family ATPase [Deltaproteobacteria bacterium]